MPCRRGRPATLARACRASDWPVSETAFGSPRGPRQQEPVYPRIIQCVLHVKALLAVDATFSVEKSAPEVAPPAENFTAHNRQQSVWEEQSIWPTSLGELQTRTEPALLAASRLRRSPRSSSSAQRGSSTMPMEISAALSVRSVNSVSKKMLTSPTASGRGSDLTEFPPGHICLGSLLAAAPAEDIRVSRSYVRLSASRFGLGTRGGPVLRPTRRLGLLMLLPD